MWGSSEWGGNAWGVDDNTPIVAIKSTTAIIKTAESKSTTAVIVLADYAVKSTTAIVPIVYSAAVKNTSAVVLMRDYVIAEKSTRAVINLRGKENTIIKMIG